MNKIQNDFRVTFKTRDGQLVMNREGSSSLWFIHGKLDKEFAEYSLKRDAIEKGVRIISYTADTRGINAIVEWV